MDKLVIVLNGQSQIEYNRNIRLPGHQREFLDRMDMDMDAGIEISGETITAPDLNARAKYIAMHLIMAIVDNHDARISAMCAYLANRLPELKQVRAKDNDGNFDLELVFEETYQNQVTVNFENNLH